jgi:hypothetical protein
MWPEVLNEAIFIWGNRNKGSLRWSLDSEKRKPFKKLSAAWE